MSSPFDFLRSPGLKRHWVRVKTSTGSAVPAHSVVLITASTITNGEIVYTVRQPNSSASDFNWGGYLITGPAIGASTSYEGWACDASIPVLAAYTGSPTVGQIFGPVHGANTLAVGYYGFQIAGSTTTSAGINVVPVKWIGIHTVLGKVDDTDVSAGSTCTVSVYNGATGTSDTSMNITALNRGVSMTGLSTPYCGVSLAGNVPILMWVAC